MNPRTARDIMTRNVVTVLDEMPVAEAARLFSEKRIHGGPVVDRKDRLVGVVTTSDIVANELHVGHEVVSEVEYYARPEIATRGEMSRLGMHLEDYADQLVRDIMTPIVISAPIEATIDEIADILGTNRIHRLLITDGDRIAGVVSALDLIGLIPARGRYSDRTREVLLATDLGPEAERIGRFAVELARDLNARLAVLHVTPDLATLMQTYGERSELPAVQKGFEELALARLQDLSRRLTDEAPALDILAKAGDPATVILDVIHERRPGYVVIGAERPARERLAGLGSVAHRVLVWSTSPVLTVPRPA